jgi:hypothetical protein
LASHARRLGDGPQSHTPRARAQRRELPQAARAAAAREARAAAAREAGRGAAGGGGWCGAWGSAHPPVFLTRKNKTTHIIAIIVIFIFISIPVFISIVLIPQLFRL